MPFFDPIRIGASGAADTAYTVDRSLRFNDDDSAYLNRQYAQEPTSQYKMTFSCWVKRCSSDSGLQTVIGVQDNWETPISFSNDSFRAVGPNTSATYITTAKYRDFSAWMHVMTVYDTQNSTGADRMICYINGERLTDFSTTGTVTLNQTTIRILRNSYNTYIGRDGVGEYGDMYLAEVNVIDGQALTPSDFTETDSTTGQLNPKKYTGSYGTNGFYLNFSDNSGTTATTLGKDSSGNSNNFTPNNFGTGDAVKDSPTNNFCTFLSIQKTAATTFSEGNLKGVNNAQHKTLYGNFGLRSGKWYWEAIAVSGSANKWTYGVSDIENTKNTQVSGTNYLLASSSATYDFGDAVSIYRDDLYKNGSAVTNSYQTTPSAGDIIGIALDVDAGKVWFARNGTWINGSASASTTLNESSHDTTVATGKVYTPAYSEENVGWQANFGQDSSFSNATTAQGNTDANGKGDFYYAVPSGFKAICSANLPDPTIKLSNQHFNTILYTGDDSDDRDITGVGFQPDWLWIKNRSQADWHNLTNAVAGANRQMYSNETDGESVDNSNGHVNSYLADGFNVTAGNSGNVNENNEDYVAWNWNAGDTDGKTYTVTVVDDSGNKFRFDGYGTSAVTLDLAEGGTYIFNYPSGHPFRFSTTSDGTHGGGSEYTTGVTHNSSTQVTIVVAASAPTLYYYCSSHSGMGGAINTNSTLGSSNFDGTIQSVVKASPTAGFSIINYTGTGSTATVGHGLGVAPEVIILKDRNASGAWKVLHKEAVSGSYEYFKNVLYLNSSSSFAGTGNSYPWGNTEPTSSVFSLGNTGSESNRSGSISSRNYVAYCFSGVAGYSKFGSYTGNGNADGTFVFTGFKPAFVITRGLHGTSWYTYDNKRNTFNVVDKELNPNNGQSEATFTTMDFLSNGFKLRTSNDAFNYNSYTYIYIAFAEAPFKNARAR